MTPNERQAYRLLYAGFVAAPIIVDWENWSQSRPRGAKKVVVKAPAGR